jgi:hypothetical protein
MESGGKDRVETIRRIVFDCRCHGLCCRVAVWLRYEAVPAHEYGPGYYALSTSIGVDIGGGSFGGGVGAGLGVGFSIRQHPCSADFWRPPSHQDFVLVGRAVSTPPRP